jgi:hypothetical protein
VHTQTYLDARPQAGVSPETDGIVTTASGARGRSAAQTHILLTPPGATYRPKRTNPHVTGNVFVTTPAVMWLRKSKPGGRDERNRKLRKLLDRPARTGKIYLARFGGRFRRET